MDSALAADAPARTGKLRVVYSGKLSMGRKGVGDRALTPLFRAQAAQIGRLDLLLLPVGGYYTIDAAQAMDVCGLLKPTVTIPMHYRTQYDPEMNIAPLADFLSLCGAEDTQMPLRRAVKAEM